MTGAHYQRSLFAIFQELSEVTRNYPQFEHLVTAVRIRIVTERIRLQEPGSDLGLSARILQTRQFSLVDGKDKPTPAPTVCIRTAFCTRAEQWMQFMIAKRAREPDW